MGLSVETLFGSAGNRFITTNRKGLNMAKATATKRTRQTLTAEEREKRDRERRAKFVELAEQRVEKALHRLRQLEPLGGYPHDDTHTEAIVAALTEGVQRVKVALKRETQRTLPGFKLNGPATANSQAGK